MMSTETIVAPATPPGAGGLAVIRISGPEAEPALLRCFSPAGHPDFLDSHRLYYGELKDVDGLAIDRILAVVMRSPRSYTGEDVAEIHCHGGPILVQQIIDRLLGDGARLARPGEFTLRAFLNGRLDLAQAEAVADLIRAESEQAARIALSQHQGKLSQRLRTFRGDLLAQLALLETHIDFNEEDIELPRLEDLYKALSDIKDAIFRLLSGFDSGRLLQDGGHILLLGKPNVGKSSLLNALLGQARAIVTPIPGTTRDTIEEKMNLGGLPIRLIDSAGVRQSGDSIEREGVRRAKEKIESSDLVLLVLDGSQAIDQDDLEALSFCKTAKTLLVINKRDLGCVGLPTEVKGWPKAEISALTGEGLQGLQAKAVEMMVGERGGPEGGQSVLLYERRHKRALDRAVAALHRCLAGIASGQAAELVALDLRESLAAIGEVTGETTPDQVLDEIFSRFCIGK